MTKSCRVFSLIHCDSRMRSLSLDAYTYHVFGGVFSRIESYY